MDLKQLIREVLEDKSCCTATKPTKAPILNENLAPREILSEGLKYHIDNKKPLTEHVYRAGSENYFNLWAEARALYTRGILDFSGDDLAILTETQLGEFGLYEGKKVPLDFIMEEIEWPEEVMSRHGDIIFKLSKVLLDGGAKYDLIDKETGKIWEPGGRAYKNIEKLLDDADDTIMPQGGTRSTYLGETTKAKKKTPPIGKPKRGGSKKFYVYVRKPGGGIKKVSFGDTTGLSAKINNPEARRAFAKRHDCANKKDRTKASYWSCRLPRYAKLLGLKSNFSGFW